MKALLFLLLTTLLNFGCVHVIVEQASAPTPSSTDGFEKPGQPQGGGDCFWPCLGGGGARFEQKERMLLPNSEYGSYSKTPNYRVWYGTNRAPIDSTDISLGFSNNRDNKMHYGTCIVDVPKSHKFGSVGSSWVWRTVTLTDDRLKLSRVNSYDEDDFFYRMSNKLGKRLRGKRTALVYIHGFNVSFEEAVIRAAQMGTDLKVEGVTAVFSWPSKGSILEYASDESTIQASEGFLEDFLRKIALESNADRVDIIAHSMGNRGLLRAMERLGNDPSFSNASPFGQIILAAPDVDKDTFTRLAVVYPQMSKRTTLYVSSKDFALNISKFLHTYPRVGFFPPIGIFPGIDTIQVTDIDLSILGHSYFAAASPVLNDMHQLLQTDVAPGSRARTREVVNSNNQKYWEIMK